ncbi:MAG: hypothetical protein RIC89_21390 [Pseudomonadales bacterium]
MPFILFALILAGLSGLSAHAADDVDQRPAWLQTDVLQAALDMQLDDTQQAQFRTALTETLDALGKRTRRLLRANNTTHLKRRIKTTVNRELNKLDDKVAVFLTASQMAKYQVYRQRLQHHMTDPDLLKRRPPARNGSDAGALGNNNPDWH